MAIIDSGLGWTCDGDYYVSAAGTTLKPPLIKTNNGGAMCAIVKWVRPGWYDFYCAYIVSTVEDNVAIHNDTEADKTIYSTTYGGRTWYISCGNNDSSVYSGTLPIIDASEIPGYYGNLNDDQNRQAIVQAITEAASIEFYKIIPSTDYVKAFVGGVEAETATRVNANKANIGALSSLTTTDKTNTVSAINEVNTRCDNIIDMIEDKTIIYGFHVNPDESDPEDAVTYLADAVGMTPASMGATAFDYGSWKNVFFMPRPCMLKYDGTVDYYLDPNDFSKKIDGTASDISDYSYNGNAMMEFPKLWFKFEAGTADGEGYFWVSNKQVDSSYHCWCNYDSDGNQIDHFYMAIYNGVIYDGKMRSLSGKKLSPWNATAYSSSATYAVDAVVNYDGKMYKCTTAVETAEAFDPTKWAQFGFNGNTTRQQEVGGAAANDTTAKSEWYIDTWCDRVVVTALLYLMSKSLDLQSTYGRGIDSNGQSAAENYVTGTVDDKGLFYGVTANGNNVVKVFGVENFWACKWRRTAGLVGLDNGKTAYKMTYSTVDGSTTSGYPVSGAGYLTDDTVRPSQGYVSNMGFGNWGLIPRSIAGGSSNTYYCDYYFGNNTAVTYALLGGNASQGKNCGFYIRLNLADWYKDWDISTCLSCKPLLPST